MSRTQQMLIILAIAMLVLILIIHIRLSRTYKECKEKENTKKTRRVRFADDIIEHRYII